MKELSRQIYTPTNLNSTLLSRLHHDDSSLVRIIFSSRNLGSAGVSVLTKALRFNTRLQAVDLSHNSIGTDGAKSIAMLLHHQTMHASDSEGGIRTLILGDNNLRDEGVNAIADAIANDIILENLSIDDNRIGASGLARLADALYRNTRLKRLHLQHNSFQSLAPLIACTFNRQSLGAVADSNHTLKHIFLNCGYSYECKELEIMMKINRLGKKEARRKKIALYLEEDFGRLLHATRMIDMKLLPRLAAILSQHGSLSIMYRLVQSFPSEVLFFQTMKDYCDVFEDSMDVDEHMDVEFL